MEKSRWSEPRLIELVRGSPEEAMLVACRTDSEGSNPAKPGTGCKHCYDTICNNCDSLTAS